MSERTLRNPKKRDCRPESQGTNISAPECTTSTPAGNKALGKSRIRCYLKWSNRAVKGLTYLYTGKGSMRALLFKIGKAESS